MITFAMCLRNSAAVTPAKYEHDIIQVTIVSIIWKKWENNGTEKIGLITPTSDYLQNWLDFGHGLLIVPNLACPLSSFLPYWLAFSV